MKRYIYLLVTIMIATPLFMAPVFANEQTKATVNQSSISLDGKEIWTTGFNVSNNNYFKLRDIAENLSNSTSRFEVSWNTDKKLIEIMTGEPYTGQAEENTKWYSSGGTYSGTLKSTGFLLDGKEYSLPVFHIDGSNYFKLRDLSALIGFDMAWDGEKSQILLYSKVPDNAYRVETAYEARDNGLYPSFPRWKDTVTSHSIENKDGTISVIEAKENLEIETYDSQYNHIKSNTIAYELPKFGGFYNGETYNYVAFGQNNTEEDNGKEVIRIVRYDKDFKRIDSVSIKGGESFTTKPFDAAAGRMAEYGDELVFHTSRERYKTSDGLNHQSQLTIIVDTSAMKVTNDLGRFQSNHVSHSFDQYALFDHNNHVLLDHGDAYPRSIVLSKESGSAYNTVDLFKIPGHVGANATGVSIGGFQDSQTSYIVAMNTVNHSLVKEYTSYEMVGLGKDQRDIMIATVAKSNLTNNAVKQTTLKKYTGTDKNGSIPQLVKISNNKLMVLWEEYNKNDVLGDLKYVLIDGQGEALGEIETIKNFSLSKSQPIVVDNKVTWYVDKNGLRTFYTIPL